MRRTVLLLVPVILVSAAFVTAPAFADSTRLCNNRCASDDDTTINNDNDVDTSRAAPIRFRATTTQSTAHRAKARPSRSVRFMRPGALRTHWRRIAATLAT
jgi:hypothetical protein